MLKVYTYAKCDTCRKAVKFLNEHAVAFQEIPIREQPPTLKELDSALLALDNNIRKLFNTSGQDYRALGLGAQLPSMTKAETLALLASNGNLVKRPFISEGDVHLIGFNEATWKTCLLAVG